MHMMTLSRGTPPRKTFFFCSAMAGMGTGEDLFLQKMSTLLLKREASEHMDLDTHTEITHI